MSVLTGKGLLPTYAETELAARRGWTAGYNSDLPAPGPYPEDSDLGRIWKQEWDQGRRYKIVEALG